MVKFGILPKTNVKYISVTQGCIGFIVSYRFLSSSLHSLVKTLVDKTHKTLESLRKKIDNHILNMLNKTGEEETTNIDLKGII